MVCPPTMEPTKMQALDKNLSSVPNCKFLILM